MPFNHLILCRPLLLLLSIFPSIRVFSNDSALRIRWPKCWSFSFSISPSNEYSGQISFRIGLISFLSKESQESSPVPQFKIIDSSALNFLHSPTSKAFSSVQFSSVTQSCLTLCNPMDCSTPGFAVHHQLLKLAQTHVHF